MKMKELHINQCIVKKRKEKGITQEQLADYIGVSKASVSKWESGLSYPDILLLPELATFFNVSVDELLGYSPQLTKEAIKKLYNELKHDFAAKPFEEVMEQCETIIKEYYSCFQLLLAMIQLLLNHLMLAEKEETKNEILTRCITLCQRVKEESDDMCEVKTANSMEALMEMTLGNNEKVISLLDDKLVPYCGDDVILINAYQMLGETEKANKVNQVLLYQGAIDLLTLLNNYLVLHMAEPALFEQIYQQGVQIIDSFRMKEILTNAVFGMHIVAAQGYLMQQEKNKALDALAQYVDIVCGFQFPLKLKGNDYFNLVDEWLEDNIFVGTSSPLDTKAVKANFIKMVEENPAFLSLKEETRYQQLLTNLKTKLQSN